MERWKKHMLRSDAARLNPALAQELIAKAEGGSLIPLNSPVPPEVPSSADSSQED